MGLETFDSRPVRPTIRLSILISLLLSLSSVLAAEDRIVVQPEDSGEPLVNPGMGWVFHYYDNRPENYGSRLAPSDTIDDFPGLSVIYLRIPWSYIEPEEGRFVWSVLDTPAQRWIDKGKQIALRISCAESWLRYATPEWVKEAGAKGYNCRAREGIVEDGPLWEPDYDDPVFLEKLDRFLAALAARYDGNPEVAFIDVGSFGVWGEGHTFHTTKLGYSAETIRRHIDLHLKHFKKALLAANDDFVLQDRGEETIRYAQQKGLTLRDDSILVQGGDRAYFHADFAEPIWRRLPIVLESEHYGSSVRKGHWKDGSQYLDAIEDYHASYASIHWWPREFLEKNRDLVRRINMRLGYRLQLVEASWPAKVEAKSTLRFESIWRNAGVALCLPGGHLTVTLKDDKGGIVAAMTDTDFNAKLLQVGPPGKAPVEMRESNFPLPYNLELGNYRVFISIGAQTGTPKIALPLAKDDSRRRYELGVIEVREAL